MRWLSEADLAGIYGAPGAASLRKVTDRVTPDYAAFLGVARFCVLTTVGPEGTDASPRGDDGAAYDADWPARAALTMW